LGDDFGRFIFPSLVNLFCYFYYFSNINSDIDAILETNVKYQEQI